MGTKHYGAADPRLMEINAAALRLVLERDELWFVVGGQEDLLAELHRSSAPELDKATMRWRLRKLSATLRSWSPTRGPMVRLFDARLLARWLKLHPEFQADLLAELEAGDDGTADLSQTAAG